MTFYITVHLQIVKCLCEDDGILDGGYETGTCGYTKPVPSSQIGIIDREGNMYSLSQVKRLSKKFYI